jgi:glutamate--cysteine ligase
MQAWARELIDSMQGVAEVFDRGDASRPYSAALAVQAAKIENVALTPSARMLAELESTGESFFDLALRMSRLHKEYFLALYPPNVERQAEFRAEADESLKAQQAIESSDKVSFEQYLAEYAAG